MVQYIYYDYAISMVCIVRDTGNEFISATSLEKYFDTICMQYGSTRKGRIDSFRFVNGSRKFTSIFVNSKLCLLPFPDQKWINFYAIQKYRHEKGFYYIFFKDGTVLKTEKIHRMNIVLNRTCRFLRVINAY